MKQKLKLLFTFSLAGILLLGCQKDEPLNESLNQQSGTILHKKFEDLILETQFKTAFEKMNKPKKGSSLKSGSSSKTVMEHKYNFTIANNAASVVTTNGVTSYTFLITRDSIVKNVFENLVINTCANQEPKAYLYKYQSDIDVKNLNHNLINLRGTRFISEIVYNITQTNGLLDAGPCIVSQEWYCGGPGNHRVQTAECGGHYVSTISCSTTSGSGVYGGSFNATSGNTGYIGNTTGSNGATPGPTVVTVPVAPQFLPTKEPCEILTPLLAEPKIDAAMTFLKPKTQGKYEFGFEVSYGYHAGINNNVETFQTHMNAGGLNEVKLGAGGLIRGIMHNHTVKGGSYPSWGDVYLLLYCENNNNNTNSDSAFSIVIVADPEHPGQTITYSMTIGNLAALQAQIDADMAIPKVAAMLDYKEKVKYFLDEQSEEFKLVNANAEKSEVKFLQYFNNYGINLSKLDPLTNLWNKLNLAIPYNPKKPNSANSILPIPCN